MRNRKPLLCFLSAFVCCALNAAESLNPLVASWLAAQTNVHSWSADFVQTRSLKTLTQPVTESGHVWFQAPNRFHWELGHPAKTLAIRATDELLVIYPRLKRVERFSLAGAQTGPWRDALALLQAGFPRNQADLESQYLILSQQVQGDSVELTLKPKSAAARKLMPQIKIAFDTKQLSLTSTELQFADGSLMRNDFKNPTLNPATDPKLFSPEVPSDYQIVDPLKRQ